MEYRIFFWNLYSLLTLGVLIEFKSTLGAAAKKNQLSLCDRSSPDFEKCLQKLIMDAKPMFIKGIPKIGFPKMDPMLITPFDFKENNRHFRIAAKFTDMNLEGLSNMTFEDVRITGDVTTEMTINLTVTSPMFRSRGKWAGRGRAFQFNVNGGGNIDVNLTQTDFKLSMRVGSKINNKDGKKYFSLRSVKFTPVIRKAHVYVTGLFPKDRNLNRMANKFINRNISFILRILKKYPETTIGAEFEKLVKIVFEAWPIDEFMFELNNIGK